MPDLSNEAAHKYWSEYQDTAVYPVVVFMEGVEEWSHDGDPTVEAALAALGQATEDIGNLELNNLGHEEEFMKILSTIKTGRGLRLLQVLDVAHPGAASKLLVYAEENGGDLDEPTGFFLRRNVVFERLRLLSRVFSKERLELALRALEGGK